MFHKDVKLALFWVVRLSLVRVLALLVLLAVHHERGFQGIIYSSIETILANQSSLSRVEDGRVDILHPKLLLGAIPIEHAALRSLNLICDGETPLISFIP